jgi:hypothetical protein
MVFEKIAISTQQSAKSDTSNPLRPSADRTVKTRKGAENRPLVGRLKSTKKGFDSSVTARSNGTLAFIFNNGNMGGGRLAEGRRQRAAKIAGIARDRRHRARSENQNLTTDEHG